MGRKVFVVGVGMTKFEKPQSKDWDYPDMAKESIGKALDGREHRLQGDRAGVRRLRLRRVDLRPARRVPVRPHRHPRLQRQQQLLDRLDRAVHGAAARRGRARRLRPRARLREDAEGLARREVHRPHEPDGQAHHGDDRQARVHRRAAGAVDVRQRRPRAHGALRHQRPSSSRGSAGRTTSTR